MLRSVIDEPVKRMYPCTYSGQFSVKSGTQTEDVEFFLYWLNLLVYSLYYNPGFGVVAVLGRYMYMHEESHDVHVRTQACSAACGSCGAVGSCEALLVLALPALFSPASGLQ